MAKKSNISIIITKVLLSIAILQLMVICFHIIPPSDIEIHIISAALRSYIPEMTEYAVLTAVLSYPIGFIAERIIKK